ILRQPPVGLAGGAREMVKRQAESAIDVGLNGMLASTIVGHRHAVGVCRQLHRRTVLVGAAPEQDRGAGAPAGGGGGRPQGSREIAEMLYAVDVRQRAGDQELAHGTLRRVASGHEKALREEGPERPSGLYGPRVGVPPRPVKGAGAFARRRRCTAWSCLEYGVAPMRRQRRSAGGVSVIVPTALRPSSARVPAISM